MRGIGYTNQSPYQPAASSPYYAAQQMGAQTGATVASGVQTVAAPVFGFWQGLTGGYGVVVGLAIIGLVLINAEKNK